MIQPARTVAFSLPLNDFHGNYIQQYWKAWDYRLALLRITCLLFRFDHIVLGFLLRK